MCATSEKNKLIFLQNILYDYLNYVIGSKDSQHGGDADHEAEYFRGTIYLSVSLSIIPRRKVEGGYKNGLPLSLSQSVCLSVRLSVHP